MFTFHQARLRAGAKPSTINRDLRTLRAILKTVRPDFRFPGAAFFPEDETRVRWLRQEEEIEPDVDLDGRLIHETLRRPMVYVWFRTSVEQGFIEYVGKSASGLARLILVTMLACGSGCAKSDWIQQTLVTVDVTGTWRDSDGTIEFTLEQQGSKVTGSLLLKGIQSAGTISAPVEGSVGGDVFRFQQTRGERSCLGEFTVSGDDMHGWVDCARQGSTSFRRHWGSLQRVDSSIPPRSQ